MPEYTVTACVQISCEITVEAKDEEGARYEADQYLDNGANYESEFFNITSIRDIEIEAVNED